MTPISISRGKHLLTLVRRRLLSFYRDKTDLSITFGQAPLLAVAFFFVFQKIITLGPTQSVFQPLRVYLDPSTVSIIVFLAVLTAVWFGSSKAIVEIPGTKILYQQERLSFLHNADYLMSIFISLAILALGQILLFSITFHCLFVCLPAWFEPYETGLVTDENVLPPLSTALQLPFLGQFTLLLWLTAMASIAVAMLISMFTPSRSAANAILPFLLIVQILFAGSVIKPVIYMSPVIRSVATLMVSRWGFEAAILMFERDLNLAMPRQDTNDNAFVSFKFNRGLNKLDTKEYVSLVTAREEKELNNHPATAGTWRDALNQASQELKFLSNDSGTSIADTQYLKELEQAQWDTGKVNKSIPSHLLGKAKELFDSLYSRRLNLIISKIDGGKIVTAEEQQVWEELIQTDPLLKLFRRAAFVPVVVEQLTEVEKNRLGDLLTTEASSLTWFRTTIDCQVPWMMLFIITVGSLTIGGIFFVVRPTGRFG